MKEPRFWWSWQPLLGRGWRHGRAWFYFTNWRYHVEWYFLKFGFALGVTLSQQSDDTIFLHFAFPGVELFFGVRAPWDSWLRRMMPEQGRECKFYTHEWQICIYPWAKQWESRSKDPWWVRGKHFDLKNIFLGRAKYTTEEIAPRLPVHIYLDGREYLGEAKFERCTWKRPRWFRHVRESTWIDMQRGHGLPYAGKGEDSWNCGDEALYGWGVSGTNLTDAVQHGIDTVQKYRQRYGMPSCLTS